MRRMRSATVTLAGVLALLWAGTALGQATDASMSTERCQKMAQKEVAKYVKLRELAIATCLQKIAQRVVKDNQSVVDVSGATSSCLSQFYKLGRSDGKSLADKMEDKIRAFCDPTAPDFKGDHVADDVSGTGTPGVNQPLEVAVELDTYCGHFGVGSASLGQWVGCLQAAAECQVHQQVAVEFGRALEWLNLMDAEFTGSSDPKKPDAQAALRAVEQAIDGAIDDNVPNLKCGPGLVPGEDPVLPATGQTTSYGTGDDGDMEAGADLSYTDNGDGTVTDLNTQLMWEKKDDNNAGSVHDWDDTYTWSATGTAFDGTVVSVLLDKLNNYCDDDEATACTTDAQCVGAPNTYAGNDLCGHAGHRDWRLANVKELQSIIDYERYGPSVDPVFNTSCASGCDTTNHQGQACSCTQSDDFYWSSTTYATGTSYAWIVGFYSGSVWSGDKSYDGYYARAVRGGL